MARQHATLLIFSLRLIPVHLACLDHSRSLREIALQSARQGANPGWAIPGWFKVNSRRATSSSLLPALALNFCERVS